MRAFTQFQGKTAVVTGGASGLGKGIARALIAEGMRVVLADVEAAALERSAAELGATGVVTDVSDPSSVQSLAEEVRRRFGAVQLVCNNAGVGSVGRLDGLTLEDWRWMIGVNLWGVIHGVHSFLPLLRDNPDGGHFLNTASVGGFVTMPGLGAYAVTKHAVVAFSETLAQELGQARPPIGVTVLCPGPTRTNIKTSSRNRPPGLERRGLEDIDLEATEFGASARWIEPDEVGRIVVAALRRGALYAFTHPEQMDVVAQRFESILRAARGAE
ncbi:MAG: SDR family NAD(P)-dependent oxidoreductase [Steroidobacteraceae bacterium]